MNSIDCAPPNVKWFVDMEIGEFGIISEAEQWVGLAFIKTTSGVTFFADGQTVKRDHPTLRTARIRILDKITISRES